MSAMVSSSQLESESGSGHLVKNSFRIGKATFPVVLFKNMVAISSCQGLLYSVSCISSKGDFGGNQGSFFRLFYNS